MAKTAAPSARVTALSAYLKSCGGRDVLFFDTMQEATEAARLLRSRAEKSVQVEAQYTRVILKVTNG